MAHKLPLPALAGDGAARRPGLGLRFRLSRLAELALAIYILAFPLMAFAPLMVAGKSIVLSYLLTLLLVPLVIATARFRLRLPLALLVLLGWIGWLVLLTMITALRGDASTKTFTQLANILIMVAQFLVVRHMLVRLELEQLYRLRTVFVIAALLTALFALYEFIALQFGLPFSYILRNANTYDIRDERVTTTLISSFPVVRVMAFTPEPSFFSSYLVVAMAILLPELFEGRKAWAWASFALLLLTLFLTFGRTGWLAFLGMLVYALLRVRRRLLKRGLIIAGIVGVAIGGFLTLGGEASRFFTTAVAERLVGQTVGLQLLLAHPLLGVGLGNYSVGANELASSLYEGDLVGALNDPFNLFLQLGAETGLIGLGLFLLFLAALWRGLQQRVVKQEPRALPLARGLEFALAGMALSWFNLGAYNLSYMWFIMAMCAALPTVLARRQDRPG